MKRKYTGADIYRTVALLWVMCYHCWVMMGYPAINNTILLVAVKLGGEIGVTLFFILSGFGIYFSIASNESRNGMFRWGQYLKARAKRICPNYYFSLLLVMAFTGSAAYVGINGIWDILAHLLFVHNLSVSTHGSINGVLWTMGVIVQFYLFAPLLYKSVKKHPYLTLFFSIAFSILIKIILFHYILNGWDVQPVIRFIWSRQVFSSMDNFVIGMFAAWTCANSKGLLKSTRKNIFPEILLGICLIGVCLSGDRLGIHTDNLSGYIFHSALAICLGGMLLCACSSRKYEGRISKGVLWLADNEYGIYIYHLCIVENLMQNSYFLQTCNGRGLGIVGGGICILIAIIVGSVLAKSVDSLFISIWNTNTMPIGER